MNKGSFTSSLRNDVGTNASGRLRDKGYIPAVIYGQGINNLPIEIDRREVESFIRHGGGNSLVEINIGGQTYTTLVKEIQRDPVTRQVIHVDLQQVQQDQLIHVTVPIVLRGRTYIEKGGAVVQQQIRDIEIECSASKIPPKFEIDIGQFKPGDALRVADIEFGEEISIINDPQSIVASIAINSNTIDDEGEVPLEEKVEPKI